MYISCFFFNDTATTEIYTLSLHDALPISMMPTAAAAFIAVSSCTSPRSRPATTPRSSRSRSEEHTSELQSLTNLVCRLLLEKKNLKHFVQDESRQQRIYRICAHVFS